ncbi:MAG: VanZ family protein [Bacteroidales bacterium]|nr:VanZ family protein [Bacteroidales bacterium]
MAGRKHKNYHIGYRLLILTVFVLYVASVIFCCLYAFPNANLSLVKKLFGVSYDKVIHFIMFLPYPMLFSALYRAVFMSASNFKILVIALFSGLFFAGLTELAQGLLTSVRTPDFYDYIADCAAIGVSTLCSIFLLLLIPKDHGK